VPNGVDVKLFSPATGAAAKSPQPTILFVGTYERRKRGRFLQEVFVRDVLPLVPEARLWMVCDDAPDGPGVEVLGRLTDEELADRYRAAWVFCLPSTYEGFGIPYVEALVSGTAVVASPNRGAREVLEDGALGVISTDADLGAELVSLLTDANRRAAYENAGLQRRSTYDQREVARSYVARIRRQLGRATGPRR